MFFSGREKAVLWDEVKGTSALTVTVPIDGYCKRGNIKVVLKLVDGMEDNGFMLDWSHILRCHLLEILVGRKKLICVPEMGVT